MRLQSEAIHSVPGDQGAHQKANIEEGLRVRLFSYPIRGGRSDESYRRYM